MTKKSVPKKINKKEPVVPEKFPYQMMDISLIDLTGLNPRGEESFKDEEFEGLKQSMKENGFYVHEPLLVRPAGDRFQLVGGHRRLQAAKDLNFELVPVMVRDVSDQDLKLLIFLDNLHRKDFSPLEEAQAIKQVLDDGSVTQTVLASKMGKSQAYVANRLRLLDAPQNIKELIISQEITPAHVQILLPFSEYPVFENIMEAVQDRVGDQDLGKLTVRELEMQIEDLISNDDSIFNLDCFSYDIRSYHDHFDFSGCDSCKDVKLLQDLVGSEKVDQYHKYCMNQGCWSVRLENAKLKCTEVETNKKKSAVKAGDLESIPYASRHNLNWSSFGAMRANDQVAMAECLKCDHCLKDKDSDPVCTDDDCFGKKERSWQREANKKAREEDKQVWDLLEEKLSGVQKLGDKELRYLALKLGERVIWSAAVKKALKPWVHLAKRSKELPAIEDIPSDDIPRLLLRFVIVQAMNGGDGLASMEQLDREIKGLGV